MNIKSGLVLLSIILITISCSSNIPKKDRISNALNNLVGTQFSSNYKLKLLNWASIRDAGSKLEYEQTLKTGCSYIIVVDKKSDIVESWKFNSDEQLCNEEIYTPHP